MQKDKQKFETHDYRLNQMKKLKTLFIINLTLLMTVKKHGFYIM